MKKSSRKLMALMLSAVMSVTAFAQGVGAAVSLEPGVSADGVEQFKTYQKVFNNIDMTTVDDDFVSAYVPNDGSGAVTGKPSEQWSANGSYTVLNWSLYNTYLKPLHRETTNLLTLKDTKTVNFKARVEMLDSYTEYGIIFGQSDPTDKDTGSGAVLVRMQDHEGQIRAEGVQPETAMYVDSSVTGEFSEGSGTVYDPVKKFPNAIGSLTGEAYRNATQTLNIEVINGLMKLWWDGYEQYAYTVELSDKYDGGYISLYSSGYDQGGIKSFEFEDYGGYIRSFDSIDASTLSDAFSASRITDGEATTGNVEDIWTADRNPEGNTQYPQQNNYLKPTQTGPTSLLTLTGVEVKNFRITMEFLNNYHDYGIYFGQKTPTDTDTTTGAVQVGMQGNSGRIKVIGADNYSPVWVGSKEYGGFDPYQNAGANNVTNAVNIDGFSDVVNPTNLHTLNIEVRDGLIKVWWSEFPDVAWTVQINEYYTGGYVSLYATGNQHGGIKDFAIIELPEEYDYSFVSRDVSELDADFTSTVYNNTDGSSVVKKVSESWRSDNLPDAETGKGNIEGQFHNNALKPYTRAATPGTSYALTLNDTVSDNFEASYTYIVGYIDTGIILSDAAENFATVGDNAVVVSVSNAPMPSGGYTPMLRVKGAIDTDTATAANDSVTLYRSGPVTVNTYLSDAGFTDYGAHVMKRTRLEVNVRVEGQTLTAWVTGYEDAALTVKLNSKYSASKLSLYSNGCDQGGFVNMNVDELADSAPQSAELKFNVKNVGEYTSVILNTNLDHSAYRATLKFDASSYEFMGAFLENENFLLNHGTEYNAEDGTLPIVIHTNPSGDIATLYFRNLGSALDYSSFEVSDVSAYTANEAAVTVSGSINVDKDYTGDKVIDLLDLVRAKKLSAESAPEVGSTELAAVRKLLLGIADNTDVSPLLGKTALYLGDSIAYGALDQPYYWSWAGRVAQSTGMTYENVAVSGWTLLGTDITGRGQIVTQLDNASNDYYDFVILEGGVNDILLAANNQQITQEAIKAALDNLIKATKAKFPGSVVGYIINNEFGADSVSMEWYISMAKEVCEDNGVAWIDLNAEPYVTENFDNKTHLPDGLHPNAEGYDILSVAITEWMEGLAEDNF